MQKRMEQKPLTGAVRIISWFSSMRIKTYMESVVILNCSDSELVERAGIQNTRNFLKWQLSCQSNKE